MKRNAQLNLYDTTHPPYGDFVSVSFVRRCACRDVDDRDPGPGSRHYKFGGQKSPPTFSKFHTVEHKRIVDCFRLKYIGVPPQGVTRSGPPPGLARASLRFRIRSGAADRVSSVVRLPPAAFDLSLIVILQDLQWNIDWPIPDRPLAIEWRYEISCADSSLR